MGRGDEFGWVRIRLFGFLVIALLLCSSFAFGQEGGDEGDADAGGAAPTGVGVGGINQGLTLDWLYNITTSEKVGTPYELGLTILASNLGSGRSLVPIVEKLKELGDGDAGCWPKGGCTVKDTAVATLALEFVQEDVEKSKAWLRDTLIAGLGRRGEWWIIIKSEADGKCTITPENGTAKEFDISEGKIRGRYHINLNDVGGNLINKVNPTVSVDCSQLPHEAKPVISLSYRPSRTKWFVLQSESQFSADLKVANACFGESARAGRCDYESSLYGTWAFSEMGIKDLGTYTYLESEVKIGRVLDLAMLNRVLHNVGRVNSYFMGELADAQSADGSFGGSVFTTGFAMLALKPSAGDYPDAVLAGEDYLQRSWSPAGNWAGDVRSTALALLGLNGDLVKGVVGAAPPRDGLPEEEINCEDQIDNDGDGNVDCGDLDCVDEEACLCENSRCDEGEECWEREGKEPFDCGGVCLPNVCAEDLGVDHGCTSDLGCDEGEECIDGICMAKAECASDEECVDLLGEGYKCEAGECVFIEEEPEEVSLWWLWLLIIVIVLGGGGAVLYLKVMKPRGIGFGDLFKKKPRGPSFEEYRAAAERARPAARVPPRGRAPAGRPVRPVRRPVRPVGKRKPGGEEELEKSLKEAEKILKGK